MNASMAIVGVPSAAAVKVQRPSLTRSLTPLVKAARPARSTVVRAAAVPEMVPDMAKRNTMNLLLLGAVSLPVGYMAYGFVSLIVPPKVGGTGDGVTAKDAAGNDVKASEWVKTHNVGDRSLTQGLKGDATYLIVNENREVEKFGVNAVCTHLGCVVPWNAAENKFMCPCHGSQYNFQGKVVRGPAPLSLALAHADVNDDIVFFSPWTETDFRTGLQPWWS